MTSSERNIGIELLRIFAMLMIVGVHIIGYLFVNPSIHINKIINTNLWVFFLCCVNCYALITGFFWYKPISKNQANENTALNISNLMSLWFRVLFYSALIAVIGLHFWPTDNILRYFFHNLTPVYHNKYWYITAYFGMFALSPLIKQAINSSPLKKHLVTIAGIFVLYSLIPILTFNRSALGLDKGYSTLWIITCAYLGGIVHRIIEEKTKLNTKKIFILFISLNIINIIITTLPIVLNFEYFWSINDCYTSPIQIFNAICLVIFFYQIKIKRNWIRKIILILSAVTLDVYLLHVHPLLWNNFFENPQFHIDMTTISTLKMLLLFFGLLLGIYLAGTIIGLIRQAIFKLLKIKGLSQFINKIFQNICTFTLKISNKLFCD